MTTKISGYNEGDSAALRLKVRQELSVPIIDALRAWLEAQLDRLLDATVTHAAPATGCASTATQGTNGQGR